jgi:hypothetical protein
MWENFGKGENRRLNTFNKKEIVLEEEINSKKVIEEYVEDKSSQHVSHSSIKASGSLTALANIKDIPKIPLHKMNNVNHDSNGSMKGVSMDGIAHPDQTIPSFHGSQTGGLPAFYNSNVNSPNLGGTPAPPA